MPSRTTTGRNRAWRRLRKGFTGAVWVVLAGVLLAVLYLHWIGFPRFVKTRLTAAWLRHGVRVDMGRVRLHGFGIVADHLTVEPATNESGTSALAARAEWHWSRSALLHRQLLPGTLRIEGGRLQGSVLSSNKPPSPVSIDDLAGEFQFLANNRWRVKGFRSHSRGAEIRISGVLTNASAALTWRLKPKEQTPESWQQRLDRWTRYLDSVRFEEGSLIDVELNGDAKAIDGVRAVLRAHIPGATWPGGAVQKLQAEASAAPLGLGSAGSAVVFQLRFAKVSTRWGSGAGLYLAGQGSGSLSRGSFAGMEAQAQLDQLQMADLTGRSLSLRASTRPEGSGTFRSSTDVQADFLQTTWGEALGSTLTATLSHGRTRAHAWAGDCRLKSDLLTSSLGAIDHVELTAQVAPRFHWAEWQPVETELGFWKRLAPFNVDWECRLGGVQSDRIQTGDTTLSGQWRFPDLSIGQAAAELYGGRFRSAVALDVVSRELEADSKLDFDVRKVSPLLSENAQHWLAQFGWRTPPTVTARSRLILPPWTERQPKWREDVLPTIELSGRFDGYDGSFRGMAVAHGYSHFSLTNAVWRLPDLSVERPDGVAQLEYWGDMQSHEFKWRVDARLDPRAARPLLEQEGGMGVLEQFVFSAPPSFVGQIWGRWHEPESLGFGGTLVATNFMFRGESCTELRANLGLSNLLLRASDVFIRHETESIRAPSATLDLTERVVFVTNAIATMDPDRVTRVIGPKVRAAIRPYRFATPPTVRVNGRLPIFDTQDADVRFEVVGESFAYWKLHLPVVSGDVYWRGDNLTITNVQGSFYGGQLNWSGQFDFSVPVGAQLSFDGTVVNADLHALSDDLGRKTNNLQGSLEGRLTITSANSDDWRSWQGNGVARLRDGFLWGIPIFGFFSPVLDAIIPGLGKSRVSSGHADFAIASSVLQTDNLEVRSPALRLRYGGTVDLKGNVDARMQAEILRDAWAVGPVISAALWPLSKAFEYRIHGTIYGPKSDPVFFPKALMWPLHPFRTLKQLVKPENAPAQAPERSEEPTTPATPSP